MENKYWSVLMILVLVVMAAIGGEASDPSCELQCKSSCGSFGPTFPDCYKNYIRDKCDPCELKCKSACAGGKGFITLPECYTDCVQRQCKDLPPMIET
ncbi:unnamed protein product [Arabidopsis thaliana]|uniref:Plant thionin family protein n=1 Tax=Arabidopsis thaliana TaxID=3702 RepID=A0A5S9YGJ6_ARATH|nr:unnamed protein product [Arabidopsis thaliana]